MNVTELFEQANTPVLLGSLLHLLNKASTRTLENIVSTCLMRGIKASMHNVLIAWKLTATLSQSLPKCTDGFLLKHVVRLEKLYDDAFIGISRELELFHTGYFSNPSKASLTKILVLSYGDFALRMISISGGHQVKSSTFSALLNLLLWPQRAILSHSCEPSVAELHRGLDTTLCVCALLSRLQQCIHIRTFLRSRAVEIRTACFSLVIAITYVSCSLSKNRVDSLIAAAASLFNLVILSLESRSVRYEAGAEIVRLLTAFKHIIASRLFENVELSILDGYAVISAIGQILGISSSAACISFWKDHPVLGNIRFSKFLHSFAYSCGRFLALCIKSAISLSSGLCEYEIPVNEQISPLRNDACHTLLYPIAGAVEIMIACNKTLLEKLTTTPTFNDLAVILESFLLACTSIFQINTGLFNGLKATLFWPIVQLFTVPDDALNIIKPQLYNCLASLLEDSCITFPIDNRLHNERFHSFTTLVLAMQQSFIEFLSITKGSTKSAHSLRGLPEAARLFRELCKSGNIRLLAAYQSVFQDAGCPLLTDIISSCFRIVSLLSHSSRESIILRDEIANDHTVDVHSCAMRSICQQMQLSFENLELYVSLLEGLTYLSLTPINGRLSSALPLTIHFLEVASTDQLLGKDHLYRINNCYRLISSALLPITPLTYLYGVHISADLKLAYGVVDSSEISLENIHAMAGSAPLTEPGLRQYRPNLLPYLPIISIGGDMLQPSYDANEFSNPSHSIDVPSILATPCVATDLSTVSSTPAMALDTGLGVEYASMQSIKSIVGGIDSLMVGTKNQAEITSKDDKAAPVALILDSSEDENDD